MASPLGPYGNGSEFAFSGVSCSGTVSCIAVGDYANAEGDSLPMSEDWDGTSWTSVDIHGPEYSGLDGVSCPDSTDCMAVGSSRYGTFAKSWNGTKWTNVHSPAPSGAIDSELSSVSCPTPSSCEAVGVYQNASSTSFTLAESWNGTSWSLVKSPNPKGVTGSELLKVACGGPTSCVAVGYSFDSRGNSSTLTESWNGTSWSLVSSPDSPTGSEDVLMGVSCVDASNCTAVGDYTNLSAEFVTLVETWDGSTWSLVSGADADGALGSVSCTSATRCMAVGFDTGTFAYRWNGTSWRVLSSPDPEHSSGSILDDVSCVSARTCNAVGYYTGKASDTTYTLAETWNGSNWTLVSSPNR